MDTTDSESEDFLSADEFGSDEETVIPNKGSKLSDITENSAFGSKVSNLVADDELTSEVRPKIGNDKKIDIPLASYNDDIEQFNKSSNVNEDTSDDNEETIEVRSYRKRPQGPKRLEPSAIAIPKPDLKPIIDIVNVARPDAIMKDFKSHLTTNLTKGLATFQETSSSLKGLVLSNFVQDTEKEEARFNYDDNRCRVDDTEPSGDEDLDVKETPVVRSAINDEILKLSEAFAKLNEASLSTENKKNVEVSGDLNKSSTSDLSNVTPIEQPDLNKVKNEFSSKNEEEKCKSENLVDNVKEKEDIFEYGKDASQEKHEEVSSQIDDWDDDWNVDQVQEPVLDVVSADKVKNMEPKRSPTPIKQTEKNDFSDNIEKISPENSSLKLEISNPESLLVNDEEKIVKSREETQEDDNVDDWGAWNDDSDIIEPKVDNKPINKLENTELKESSVKIEPEIIKSELEAKQATEIVDGWGDWKDSDEEVIPEEEEIEETTDIVSKDGSAEQGWDDWGDEITEEPPKPQIEKKKAKESEKSNIEKKDEDEGWGDWGDDDDALVEAATKVEADNKASSSSHGLSSKDAATPNEWRGWDSFGKKKDNEWGIGGWGFNTLLNTATAVTSNISAVTHGLTNVIESGLGIPDPETMARITKEEEKNRKEPMENVQESSSQFPFQHIVSGVGKIVEVAKVQEIGSRVLSGGLDTLETIGKKTMEVLQEGDPGLKKKRTLLLGQGQMLSAVLKEARDRAAEEDKKAGELAAGKRCHFETLFDDFQGLVHLEALEMLSRQCQIRIEQLQQSLSPAKLQELLDTLDEVNQLCEIDDDFNETDIENFREAVSEAASPLVNELSVVKIIEVHERLCNWIEVEATSATSPIQLYNEGITTIAELTASVTQQFHKSGELLILKERRKTVEEADCLLQLSSILCSELSSISNKLSKIFSQRNEPEVEILTSNLRIESGNAIAYIKQAFGLLVPVLQLGAT